MQAHDVVVRPPQAEQEETLIEIQRQALCLSPGALNDVLRVLGPEQFRVVLLDQRVAGGLVCLPMGQWFGGRRVPMTGIAAVAVAPEYRGRGAAAALMIGTLRDLRAQGVALSALYPATIPVYRKVGYELAGLRYEYQLPLTATGPACRELEVEPVGPERYRDLDAVYGDVARVQNGLLDRPPMMWRRILTPSDTEARTYAVSRRGEMEGFVAFSHVYNQPIKLRAISARTAVAARCLLTLLADHRSVARSMNWFGGPADQLLQHVPDRKHEIVQAMEWMLRLVDLPAALTARGYNPQVSTKLELEARDEHLPENSGRWLVEVEAGTARVTPGGTGRLKADIRALAAMYAGHWSPARLAQLGHIEGDETSLQAAELLFAGPAPWMPDFF